jgi:hypothetical protein
MRPAPASRKNRMRPEGVGREHAQKDDALQDLGGGVRHVETPLHEAAARRDPPTRSAKNTIASGF